MLFPWFEIPGFHLSTLLLRRLSILASHWAFYQVRRRYNTFLPAYELFGIVFLHLLNHSERHSVGVLSKLPQEARVIGPDYTLRPVGVRTEPLHCFYNTQRFGFCCGVTYFHFTLDSRLKSYRTLFSVNYLQQSRTECRFTCVCINHKGVAEIWER